MDSSVDEASSLAFQASGGESKIDSRTSSRSGTPQYRRGVDDAGSPLDGRFDREWHTPSVIGVNAVDHLSAQLRVRHCTLNTSCMPFYGGAPGCTE